jgi:hypothetical protein
MKINGFCGVTFRCLLNIFRGVCCLYQLTENNISEVLNFQDLRFLHFISSLFSLQDVHVTDNPLLLRYQLGGTSELTAQFYVRENLEDTAYEVVNKTDLWVQFIHLRLQTRLPLTCELQADAINEALLLLQKKVGGICSLPLLRDKVVVGFVGQGYSNVMLVLCVGILP